MFIILYRWKIKPKKEKQFIESWAEITEYFRREFDSLGSRLHLGSDGYFYAYAQWKSAEDREKAFAESIKNEASEKLNEAIAERLEPVQLEIMSDFLIFSENT